MTPTWLCKIIDKELRRVYRRLAICSERYDSFKAAAKILSDNRHICLIEDALEFIEIEVSKNKQLINELTRQADEMSEYLK